jgi:hypothetical protein
MKDLIVKDEALAIDFTINNLNNIATHHPEIKEIINETKELIIHLVHTLETSRQDNRSK